MGIFNTTESAERQHKADLARCEAYRKDIRKREAEPRDGVSFDALVAADDEVQSLRRKLVIAEGVAARSYDLLERARAAAAERAAEARHSTEERNAAADTKLIRELDAVLRKAAALRDQVASSVARSDAYNAERGKLPFVLDAESRVRQTPATTRPPIFQTRKEWLNKSGKAPGQWRKTDQGELIPDDHYGPYTLTEIRYQSRAEEFVPAAMPPRYADVLHLVDIAGRKL